MSTQDFEKQRIREVLDRAFFALDSQDHAMLAACFSPEASATYHQGLGNETTLNGRDAVATYTLAGAPTHPFTCHAIANLVITLDGAQARVTSHATVTVVAATGLIHVRGIRYTDDLSRNGDAWLIHNRIHRPLWQYEAQSVPPGPPRA